MTQRRVQDARDAFDKAKAAAVAGDFPGMATALFASHFVDGLVVGLADKFPDVPRDEIKECVSKAIAAAYEQLRTGKPIFHLAAWLRKVAEFRVIDAYDDHYRQRGLRSELPEAIDAPDDIKVQEERHQRLKAEALLIARNLLPQLGHANVQRVMSYVFDAVEQGIEDLPSPEIARALGLSSDSVRQALSRGFRRLERLAVEYGLNLADVGFTGDEAQPNSTLSSERKLR